jgi:CheY-like chemotaxis protein
VSRRRLLVVDDDRSILSVLRSYFHGLGWEVETCAVVLFTAAREEALREEAFRPGADEVIWKPSPLARLRDATLRAVKKP